MKRLPILLVLLGMAIAAHAHDGNALHNRADEQIKERTELLSDEPDNKKALMERGILYMKQDEYEAALVDFEHLIRLDAKTEGYRYSRAWTLAKMSDLKAAFADLDALCAADTKVSGVWFTRGELRHELGEDQAALEDLDKAVKVAPKKYPHGFVVRARVHEALKDHQGALADLKTTLELDPTNVEALLDRALLEVDEAWEQAKADLAEVMRNPSAADDPHVLATQARMQLRRNGMQTEVYTKALEVFDREVKFSRSAHRKAALMLEKARLQADFAEVWPAVEELNGAIEMAPGRVDLHRFQVRLLEKAQGTKPETLANARRKLAEVEAAHGVAPVGSG
jgi:tetratricopeptide (TPR) repeat protein